VNIRERLYASEEENLSRFAMHCKDTKGRERPMDECPIRTDYMRDRDRIVHSKAFRRMKDKTQVFINPRGSHYRTRLTHTMEVAQIARTIARALNLNEDLTEAIALGHDLGHTPFGHAGERALAQITGHFEHNEQSLRVVRFLEKDGRGLNLTYEVRDGILKHKLGMKPCTLEGMVVNYSDRIAYINHDIDDSIRAGIISEEDLPKRATDVLGRSHGDRINSMIRDIVRTSVDKPYIKMSDECDEATIGLRRFMFDRVYLTNPDKKAEEAKVIHIIELLFELFRQSPEEIPRIYLLRREEDGLDQCICDYIAGMTDKYAVGIFEAHYIPHSWTKV
jgi:dGTPase